VGVGVELRLKWKHSICTISIIGRKLNDHQLAAQLSGRVVSSHIGYTFNHMYASKLKYLQSSSL
jgi:hypothetical protein